VTNDAGGVPGGPGTGTGIVEVSAALARRVRQLAHGETLTIAELTESGVIRWEVRRGEDGIARPWFWPATPWELLCRDGSLSADAVREAASLEGGALAICTAPGHRSAEQALTMTGLWPAGTDRSVIAGAGLSEVLADVLRCDPITLWYELVVLRRTGDGYLETRTIPLFPRSAQRGDTEQVAVRCESSDSAGTVFAVVARDQELAYRMVSRQSAVIPTGTYELTAELLWPGNVRFTGLPVDLRDDPRDWLEIIGAIPSRLERAQPAHLIVAIESSGAAPDVHDRIGRAEQLVRFVARQPDNQVIFSLLCYGPHAVHRTDPEVPVTTLAWGDSATGVLDMLGRLAAREPAPMGYPAAAQIECLLAEVTARLGTPGGGEFRPVLVTIGARPAFPDRVNSARIIPCRRHDWRAEVLRLQRYQGITFGAMRDRGPGDGYEHAGGPGDEVWQHLGSTAFAWLDAVEMPRFAATLGLVPPPAPPMPLPFDAAGGA
jgi:hypothetical protein